MIEPFKLTKRVLSKSCKFTVLDQEVSSKPVILTLCESDAKYILRKKIAQNTSFEICTIRCKQTS